MYELTYFNEKGRAEPIRFIFALKEISYKDIRVNRDDWPEMKNTLRWGQLPALDVEGKGRLLKSGAITKYLARKYGLVGADSFEVAQCEELGEVWKELRIEQKKYSAETDVHKTLQLRKRLLENIFPTVFAKLEQIKVENGGSFLVGKQLTWIDIQIATGIELFQQTVDQDFANAYPALLRLQENIYNIPQIKTWIQIRPKTNR